MPEVADILRRYGQEYLDRFGDAMPPRHRRAIQDILRCRTPLMGGHVYACDRCGHREYAYHSCRNRSCPKCHTRDIELWLRQRRTELLPVPYFHAVFTLPAELRRVVRQHQARLYGVLMSAAAAALIKLAKDPRYVGGQIGALAVLHTWTRTLEYHPHVHCLVPGGGIGDDGKWRQARNGYLVPVRALSRVFRGLFADLARKAHPDIQLPQAIFRKEWVVYCKPTVHGADKVLEYLGRYVHRVAITNRRILSIDDDKIVFRYQRPGAPEHKTMTIGAQEFIRRFLQHVLPKGVHKVRYFGIWAPSKRSALLGVQRALAAHARPSTAEPRHGEHHDDAGTRQIPARAGASCSLCGTGTFVRMARLPPQPRSPP